MILFDFALLAIAGAGVLYHALAAVWLRRWIGEGKKTKPLASRPPVTFFRPIKRGVPRLRDKLESLINASAAGDQVIFGADENDDLEICEAARLAHADRDIAVVRCGPSKITNPKIAKLVQMSPHARHGHWIVSDSEALLDAEFVEKFCAEWITSGAIGISAPYRFVGGTTLPQRLDQAAALVTLWPGIAMARQLGRGSYNVVSCQAVKWPDITKAKQLGKVRFFLGACMALKKSDLDAVGGWERFGDFLAEDNRLGAALAERGKVLLSAQIVTLGSDPMNWRDYFSHQHRVAVTYRVCDTAGFFAMAITHGIGAATLLVVFSPLEIWRWFVLAAVLVARVASAFANARTLHFLLRGFFSTTFLASIAEIFFWLASWLPLRVRWGARRLRLTRGGKIRA